LILKNNRRLLMITAVLAVVVVVLAVLTFMNQGFLDMYRAYKQDRELTQKIEAARAEADSLKAEIERLKSDTAYIEGIAREKLGMARKGEKIIKFVDSVNNYPK
jgi:cell division protein FtsL